MKYSIDISIITTPFNQAVTKGFCYLCQRKVSKCDHTKACKGCDKMWINCICKTKKGNNQ